MLWSPYRHPTVTFTKQPGRCAVSYRSLVSSPQLSIIRYHLNCFRIQKRSATTRLRFLQTSLHQLKWACSGDNMAPKYSHHHANHSPSAFEKCTTNPPQPRPRNVMYSSLWCRAIDRGSSSPSQYCSKDSHQCEDPEGVEAVSWRWQCCVANPR